MSKLSVRIESFKPVHSNTLFGFVTVTVPELRMRITDISVHEQNGKRWVGLPAKAQIDRNGNVRKSDAGKVLYVPVIEFVDKATRDAFSDRVITALLEFAPTAFSESAA